MASPELSARLRYLYDSAHLLAASSPEVSRHLMSKHNSLQLEHNLDLTESQRREACGACGTIIILGWEGKLEIESQKVRRGKKRPIQPASKQPKAMVYTCNSCSSKTRFPIPTSLKPARHKVGSARPITATVTKPATTVTDTTPTARSTRSSNAKKRSKSKKYGGLSAILAKQKASQSAGNGFGLDLMDFMKKS